MKVDLYQINDHPSTMRIVPGTKQRDWMDETPYKYAYRCLPMSMANCTGWDVYAPCDFVVSWNGGEKMDDLHINYELDDMCFGASNFGSGILTFHTGYVMKTEAAWDMMVTGPINESVPWAAPLTGIVETSWLNFSFTINWQLHAAGSYTFDSSKPIARLIPIPHDYEIETTHQSISDDPAIEKEFEIWNNDRKKITREINEAFDTYTDVGDVKIESPKTHWEKTYYVGKSKHGVHVPGHNIKREFPKFEDH
jgi:hypothetical protein